MRATTQIFALSSVHRIEQQPVTQEDTHSFLHAPMAFFETAKILAIAFCSPRSARGIVEMESQNHGNLYR
jgi:hypothetical protein